MKHFEPNMSRIEDKIDTISERLSSIDATLAAQHVSLKEHMRRTEILETQIEPIKTHVTRLNGALQLIGLVGTISAIIVGVINAIRLMKGLH